MKENTQELTFEYNHCGRGFSDPFARKGYERNYAGEISLINASTAMSFMLPDEIV